MESATPSTAMSVWPVCRMLSHTVATSALSYAVGQCGGDDGVVACFCRLFGDGLAVSFGGCEALGGDAGSWFGGMSRFGGQWPRPVVVGFLGEAAARFLGELMGVRVVAWAPAGARWGIVVHCAKPMWWWCPATAAR